MSALTVSSAGPRHEHPFTCLTCQSSASMVIESFKIDATNSFAIIIDSDCLKCGGIYHYSLPFDRRDQLVEGGSPIKDLYGTMLVHCGTAMTRECSEANQGYIELHCNCGYRNDVYLT